MEEDGYEFKEVCNIISTNRWEKISSLQEFAAIFEGLQSKLSKDQG